MITHEERIKQSKPVVVWYRRTTYEAMKRAALKDGRSLSEWIRRAIERALRGKK